MPLVSAVTANPRIAPSTMRTIAVPRLMAPTSPASPETRLAYPVYPRSRLLPNHARPKQPKCALAVTGSRRLPGRRPGRRPARRPLLGERAHALEGLGRGEALAGEGLHALEGDV